MNRQVYDADEVAAMLGVSVELVYRRAKAGEIPSLKIGGRRVFPRRRFEAWLDGATSDHAAVVVDSRAT